MIPALDEESTIGRQLTALITQAAEIGEIIVVDNGSSDRTAQIALGFDSPVLPVRVITEKRRGANSARNAGIAAAGSDRILLCDADDEVRPGWAAALSTLLDTFDLVGSAVEYTSSDPARNPWVLDLSLHPLVGELCSPITCSAALRRQVWQQNGGFDPRIRRGYEEIDFFLRAQLHGASVGWAHEPLVAYHQTIDRASLLLDEHHKRINMGRVHALAWLHGYPRRRSVLPSAVKLLGAIPVAIIRPSRPNRTRVSHHWSICRDRVSSHLRLGLPELLRSGWSSGFRRTRGS